ncbi:hypothetical protein ACLOJK_013709 [Asimina triloba]
MSYDGFISVGNKTTLQTPGIIPFVSTLRFFPDEDARKYCYVVPVVKGGKYLVRTTYYYGGFDGGKEPPVFDQIIDGTTWSTVNTSESFANGLTSYYEIVVSAPGKVLSVCLARSEQTKSSPFINAVELEYLENSMYNSTDFNKYALGTIARHRFGFDGGIMSFPDDPYNRYWEAFMDDNPTVSAHSNVTSTDFWNLPPAKAFEAGLTTSRGKTLQVQWPPMSLPTAAYYIALYFQDNRTPSPYSWRVFNVAINDKTFYNNLNVTAAGISVFGNNWPLSGKTQVTLTPEDGSPVGPVINAGEVLQLLPLGGRTHTRDDYLRLKGSSCCTVIAMDAIARSFTNPPADWKGDPCLPPQNSWTGLSCTQDKFARVITLNLTGYGISGSLSPSFADLTAAKNIWLGDNKLSGSIPALTHSKKLVSVHLENNQLNGKIPESLADLEHLKELYVSQIPDRHELNGPLFRSFLQNNKFEGDVPERFEAARMSNYKKKSDGICKALEENGTVLTLPEIYWPLDLQNGP